MILCFVTVTLVNCQHNNSTESTPPDHNRRLTVPRDVDSCPFWYVFNHTSKQCECHVDPSMKRIVRCNKEEVWLRVGYCMTSEETADGQTTLYIATCFYFQGNPDAYRITGGGNYIILPRNSSELNNYMCGPIRRKGRVCSECIDGFGPSVTSLGAICSNCSHVWYGVPLYLFMEFVPITVFYLIILLFGISVTSAPMVAFVVFSQIEVSFYVYFGNKFFFGSKPLNNFALVLTTFYSFWNLDFFRYILLPFCISPRLNIVHITFMYYMSAFYPLCLICATWFCIELHSRSFKPIVWLWEKVTICTERLKIKLSYSNSLIDVFATFFLLSYAKIVFVSNRILSPTKAFVVSNYSLHTRQLAEDPSIAYFSKGHLPFAVSSIVICLVAIMPLILLLSFYPIRAFRQLLFKCLSTRAITSVNIFVEKYYSCYRDGTGQVGERDMRSLVSLYFVLRILVSILYTETLFDFNATATVTAILYGGCTLLIALVRPYKKTHMSVIDALIFGNTTLLTLLLDYRVSLSTSDQIILCIFTIFLSFPLVGLVGIVTYKMFTNDRFKKVIKTIYFCCLSCRKGNKRTDEHLIQFERVTSSASFSASEIKMSGDCGELFEISQSQYTAMEDVEELGVYSS